MRFLLAGVFVLLLSACLNKPDCLVSATNIVQISLKKIAVDSVNAVTFSSIKVSGTDSLFYKNKKVSSLSLPVNPLATLTTFTFYYGTKTDSVTLTYTVQDLVISPECGAYFYYQNLAVSSTSFTSVKVKNNQLTTSATTNLEIKL